MAEATCGKQKGQLQIAHKLVSSQQAFRETIGKPKASNIRTEVETRAFLTTDGHG